MYKYSELLYSAFNTFESEVSNIGNTLSSESEPNIAIQIEEQLEKLGLPSHHIHYKAWLGQNSVKYQSQKKLTILVEQN